MTDHTPAAQAAMQEAVRNAIRKAYDDGYNDAKMAPDNCSTYCGQRAEREGTAALLSKLRAPVADERGANPHIGNPYLADAWQQGFLNERRQYRAGPRRQAYKDGQAARAALASAPVAGEAQDEKFIQAAIDQAPEPLRRLGEYLSRVLDEDQWATAERMLLGACYAAPQASSVAGEAAYYAVMHGQALYGIFDSEAAAEACKEQGHPDAPFSVKPLYAAPQASEADPLQGAADWLMRAFEPPLSASDLARQLVIGYNRATRLRDAALSAQPGAQKGGSDGR